MPRHSSQRLSAVRREIRRHVAAVRAVDTHSHMGSVHTAGVYTDLRCVLEPGAPLAAPYSIFDLLCGAYAYWGIPGTDQKQKIYETGLKDPVQAFHLIQPFYEKWKSTGHWQAIKLALRDLHGFTDESITELNVGALDERLRAAYAGGYYARGAEVLKQAGVEKSLKMVQVPWLMKVRDGQADSGEARRERDLIFPVCSIDLALNGPTQTKDVCRDRLFEALNFRPQTADEYRELVKKMFAVMDAATVCGLKNATAYGRDLNFAKTADAEFDAWVADFTRDPKTTWENAGNRKFIAANYLMRRVLAEANQRRWPIQMHAGMTALESCDPSRLVASKCLSDFPEVKFVLLHVYPFEAQHAVLLRATLNLYADLSWLSLSSGDLLEHTLMQLIGFPADYRIVIGLDAPSFEEAYGAMVMARRALENALVHKVESGYLALADAVEIPYRLLRNNAVDIWHLPLERQAVGG